MVCEICGSDRVVDGPAYARDQTTCMECGSMMNREVPRETTVEERSVAIPELDPADLLDPAKAEAYLKRLQGTKIPKTVIERKNKVNTKPPKVSLTTDLEPAMLMAVIHRYSRAGEAWNTVLKMAKDELEYRNNNVLCIAHNHAYDEECTNLCKQV